MCTPWSLVGKRKGLGDVQMESFFVWINEMVEAGSDLVTLENSAHFPLKLFTDRMSPRCHVVSVVVDAPLLGWPTRRKRLYATAIDKETFVWTGPENDEEIAKDFEKIFGVESQLDASVFWSLDTDEAHHQLCRELCRLRGVWFKPHQAFDIRAVLPPNMLRFYDKYAKMRQAGSRVITHGQGKGGFACDLSQDPHLESRARYGTQLTTLCRNSRMMFMAPAGGKFYTADELDFSQGWPSVVLPINRKYASCVPFDMTRMSQSARMHVVGNGMHLVAIGAFELYIAGYTVRRSRHQRLPLQMQSPAALVGSDDEENDADAMAQDALNISDLGGSAGSESACVLSRSLELFTFDIDDD